MINLEKLVETFEQNVIAQTEALKNNDYKSGNRFAKRYIKAFEQIRKTGNAGRDELAMLLQHERVDVKIIVAAFLLRYKNTQATAVLKEIAKGEGFGSFEASQTLKRWEEGTWNLDPEN